MANGTSATTAWIVASKCFHDAEENMSLSHMWLFVLTIICIGVFDILLLNFIFQECLIQRLSQSLDNQGGVIRRHGCVTQLSQIAVIRWEWGAIGPIHQVMRQKRRYTCKITHLHTTLTSSLQVSWPRIGTTSIHRVQ